MSFASASHWSSVGVAVALGVAVVVSSRSTFVTAQSKGVACSWLVTVPTASSELGASTASSTLTIQVGVGALTLQPSSAPPSAASRAGS